VKKVVQGLCTAWEQIYLNQLNSGEPYVGYEIAGNESDDIADYVQFIVCVMFLKSSFRGTVISRNESKCLFL
jgi:hypothetical protein